MDHVPVELWQTILVLALNTTVLYATNENTGHDEFETTRKTLRSVCASWQQFVDSLADGGWCILDAHTTTTLFQRCRATRIDIRHPSAVSLSRLPALCHARILTINTPNLSIDRVLATHGTRFPFVQSLDLRPASSILYAHTGVSAPPGFFSLLATLFPHLSTLSIALPASSPHDGSTSNNHDILSFPHLTHLSYRVFGVSRLTDTRRCDRMADWSLPRLVHLDIQPVASTQDWRHLRSALISPTWSRATLYSLRWDAAYPDPAGIEITPEDVALLARIKQVDPGRITTRLMTTTVSPRDCSLPTTILWPTTNGVRVH